MAEGTDALGCNEQCVDPEGETIHTKGLPDPGGEGTKNFNQLENRPKYGGEPMTGDTDIPVAEPYTLPAATADTLGGVKVGDGLSVEEDGTISAEGGLPEIEADSNLWELDYGVYKVTSEKFVNVGSGTRLQLHPGVVFITANNTVSASNISVEIVVVGKGQGTYNAKRYWVRKATGEITDSDTSFNFLTKVRDILTSYSSNEALSANQGRALNEKIGDLSSLDTTDKTNLVNAINEVAGASGGGVTTLTAADYDYPADSPTSIQADNLAQGIYVVGGDSSIRLQLGGGGNIGVRVGEGFLLLHGYEGRKLALFAPNSTGSSVNGGVVYSFTRSGNLDMGASILTSARVINSLTVNSTALPLSATQGKVLNDKIGGDLSNLDTTDKASLIAAINELTARVAALEGGT